MKGTLALLCAAFAVPALASAAPQLVCYQGELYATSQLKGAQLAVDGQSGKKSLGETPALGEMIRAGLFSAGYALTGYKESGTCAHIDYERAGKDGKGNAKEDEKAAKAALVDFTGENPKTDDAKFNAHPCVERAKAVIDHFLETTKRRVVAAWVADLDGKNCRYGITSLADHAPPAGVNLGDKSNVPRR